MAVKVCGGKDRLIFRAQRGQTDTQTDATENIITPHRKSIIIDQPQRSNAYVHLISWGLL